METNPRARAASLSFLLLAVGCATLPQVDRDLYAAVKANDATQIDRLLAAGARIDVRDERQCDGLPPLGCAAGAGSVESAELLIARGAGVNDRNRRGGTPLHAAAYQAQPATAAVLIRHGADVNVQAVNGWTPLHSALEHLAEIPVTRTQPPEEIAKTVGIVQLLLASGARADAAARDGGLPIHMAAATRQKALVQLFLDRGADVNAPTADGATPLYVAARQDAREVAELLLDRGASLGARTRSGYTPLKIVAEEGNADTTKLLLDRGADVEARDNQGRTPLVWACNGLLVRYTLQSMTPAAERMRRQDSTLQVVRLRETMREIKGEYAVVALLLLDHGADPNVGVGDHRPLRTAAIVGDRSLAEALLAHGAEVNPFPDHDAESPLHAAIAESHADVAELLVDKGADVNARNRSGRTPLHFAAVYTQDRRLAELLLAHGADVNATDPDGHTPLDYAVKKRNSELVQFLKEHGAH